ncbi:MAG TPA: hypothetical protein VH880_06285 [Anaeromyxobacteraceae bacterium]|jgi:hypothetical protein
MGARRAVAPADSRSAWGSRSSTYKVAEHRVFLSGRTGAWNVNVDEKSLPNGFATEAEAWEAGVREADRLDRLG